VAEPLTPEWYDQVDEKVLDPDQAIIDPHHHLWPPGGTLPYGPDELHADVASGHRVEHTVFMECGAAYRPDGPAHLRSVGETEFVTRVARSDPRGLIAAMIVHSDLSDTSHLAEALDTHAESSGGLVRGIRDALASEPHREGLRIPGTAPAGKSRDPAFREGVAVLGRRALVYESWHYHHQNRDFAELARSVPDTLMVLDHFGTPLGVGVYEGHRDEIFAQWKIDITEIAACDNVVAKIGGMAMPDNGFGWHRGARPPTSDEFVAAQRAYYEHTIESFGPQRCMFESNFPIDRFSLSYRVLWNALKKIAAPYSESERHDMFYGTASRVYKLTL
jgi:predicted TIM-barrel fold metal-dependent hydrolase